MATKKFPSEMNTRGAVKVTDKLMICNIDTGETAYTTVAELLAEKCPIPIEMIGVRDRFGESGDPWELMKKFHLMPEDIVAACEKAIKRKTK